MFEAIGLPKVSGTLVEPAGMSVIDGPFENGKDSSALSMVKDWNRLGVS